MNKINHFVGVDISKDKFDVWDSKAGHRSFANQPKGFREFTKQLSSNSFCVMEATGSYYQQLAMYLYGHKISLAVVNPISIKRFIQMKLQQNKTDKSDARMIALYGQEQPGLSPWIPAPEYITQCKQLQRVIVIYLKQNTSLKNHIQSLESRGVKNGVLIRSLKRQLKQVRQEIALLEAEMQSLIHQYDADLFVNLSSIPGIGKKTAAFLIILTNGFRDFDNYRQVSSFCGLSPTEHSSGTSIKGRSRISKRGNPYIRNQLFMCSFTASQCNPQCQLLYQRLVNKGKSKKLALIAVCNKLIKQSFAVAQSGIPYDPAYRSRIVCQ
ncbi:IS110 family transposase [Prolixibacter denitrificans]|jgi:transposase|uniref:IS110 family transposase n=1 Tax=Prolixibacter denitrificans TaxID=1541063 RepID=A0ABQ0ZNG6_9BACT|nr:IS110 family transposase [Prolixibacter denitrificans]GET22496.1 IS110 family transposase [Prolixibacter denitrificans]GET23002.1 IS110 family transposase [Prolixibacter denitrificans]GET23005.1 IS110 family transposase [Prolixibacter denitrificans]